MALAATRNPHSSCRLVCFFCARNPGKLCRVSERIAFCDLAARYGPSRVIIWEYTAEQVLKHPLLGVGVASTPVLTDQQRAAGPLEKPEGFVYPRTLGSHAHDMFLQTWFELGAMGAILLAMVGVTVVLLIPLLPTSAQPFAAGTFATFALVAAFSWGVWQMWFMCTIALLPLCLRIASTTVDTAQRNCDEAFAR